MNEPEFGNKVRHVLNQGTHLGPRVEARLRTARKQLVKIFDALGPGNELAGSARRRLSSLMFA